MANECRSCQAPIIWVETEATKTKAGRAMPLDADPDNPSKALVVANGNLINTGAKSGKGNWIVRYVPAGKGKFRSHFASCPNSTSHRKR